MVFRMFPPHQVGVNGFFGRVRPILAILTIMVINTIFIGQQ